MSKMLKWVLGFLLLWACNSREDARPPLIPATKVELKRYLGTWYVAAHIPTFFERKIVASSETYTMGERADEINILYQGRKNNFDGDFRRIPQTARVLDLSKASEWEVKFLWLFRLPYLIIEVDPDYQWSIVGHPQRKYLWIMTREPHVSDKVLGTLIDKAKLYGYDISKIERVPQP